MKNKTDWRENIKDHNSLSDIEPAEAMILFRHNYLECAKDLFVRHNSNIGSIDYEVAEKALILALTMQDGIETSFNDLCDLEPSR